MSNDMEEFKYKWEYFCNMHSYFYLTQWFSKFFSHSSPRSPRRWHFLPNLKPKFLMVAITKKEKNLMIYLYKLSQDFNVNQNPWAKKLTDQFDSKTYQVWPTTVLVVKVDIVPTLDASLSETLPPLLNTGFKKQQVRFLGHGTTYVIRKDRITSR